MVVGICASEAIRRHRRQVPEMDILQQKKSQKTRKKVRVLGLIVTFFVTRICILGLKSRGFCQTYTHDYAGNPY